MTDALSRLKRMKRPKILIEAALARQCGPDSDHGIRAQNHGQLIRLMELEAIENDKRGQVGARYSAQRHIQVMGDLLAEAGKHPDLIARLT